MDAAAMDPLVLKAGQCFGYVEHQWSSPLVTVSLVRYAQARTLPRHAHDCTTITLLLRGAYSEITGSRRLDYQPLAAVCQTARVPHDEATGLGGADLLVLELPAPLFPTARVASAHGATPRDLTGSAVVWDLLRLYGELTHAAENPLAIEEAAAEIAGAIGPCGSSDTSAAPGWLQAVDTLIDRRFRERLCLATLARCAGVTPLELTRAYQAHRGQTLRDALLRRRLREAHLLLRDGRRAAGEVAVDVGLPDARHLSIARTDTATAAQSSPRRSRSAAGATSPGPMPRRGHDAWTSRAIRHTRRAH